MRASPVGAMATYPPIAGRPLSTTSDDQYYDRPQGA